MKPLRLAVWSGPRNISTAMMRAWENRGDCEVIDEPLYAHYLTFTGIAHPGREQVIAAGETDWRKVVQRLVGDVPGGRAIYYQKHMTHHLLPHIDRGWLREVQHVFLIRDPRDVLLSYVRSRSSVTLEDIGIMQELALVEYVTRSTGRSPPVIDAGDFLKDPGAHLRALCSRLQIEFTSAMLHWPPGRRASDGVWAPYWYDAVIRSSGFEPYRERDRALPPELAPIADAAMPAYHALHDERMAIG